MPTTIQIARGPWTYFFQHITLKEGEMFEAAIIASDGAAYEMLYIGGHDNKNKMVGCVGQTCQGKPTFQAPLGAEVFDTVNQYKWVSNGWGTSNVPADGMDTPAKGMITASNFNGWTAYCPCVLGAPPGYGSGTGGGAGTGGGGAGLVATSNCPQGVATALFLNVSAACNSALIGNFNLQWNSVKTWWQAATFMISGYPVTYLLLNDIASPLQWRLAVSLNTTPGTGGNGALYSAASLVCQPFSLTGSGSPDAGALTSICPMDSSLTWSVDD